MNSRTTLPAPIRALLLVAAWSATLTGCVPSKQLAYAHVGFSERIRPDREPLDPVQRQQDPGYGTFSTVDQEPVAELFPDLVEGSPDNLAMTGCLWIAHDASQVGAGDAIRLSWEAVIEVLNADGSPYFENTPRVAVCRLTDPATGQAVQVDRRELVVAASSQGLAPSDVFAFAAGDGPVVFERDISYNGVSLIEHRPSDGEISDNRYGSCPSQPFSTRSAPLSVDNPLFRCRGDGTVLTACATGCEYVPLTDASFELSGTASDSTARRAMRTDVMVVRGERRLARPTVRSQNVYRWSVDVATDPADAARVRWSENFTDKLRVSEVRFFERQANGTEDVLSTVGNSLCVRDSQTGQCRWTCTGTTDPQSGGAVFDLRQPGACSGPPGAGLPELTPGYDTALLEGGPGTPLLEPLVWEAGIVGVSTERDVYIDFVVRSEFGPAALTVEPAGISLGDVALGSNRQASGRIRNAGGHAVRIDSVRLVGPHAADYTAMLPTDPKPVPVPIDVTPADGGSGSIYERAVDIAIGADAGELPLLQYIEQESVIAVGPSNLDGYTLNAYGENLTFEGDTAFYSQPGFDFVAAARQATHATRPVFRPAWLPRALPFTLLPGQSADVLVTVRPTAAGARQATLEVAAVPLSGSTPSLPVLQQALIANGITGPIAAQLPFTMVFGGGSNPWQRTALLQNVGQLDMTRAAVSVTGPDAAVFRLTSGNPAQHTLTPGEFEDFTIDFIPNACGQPYPVGNPGPIFEAALNVETDGGDAIYQLVAEQTACLP